MYSQQPPPRVFISCCITNNQFAQKLQFVRKLCNRNVKFQPSVSTYLIEPCNQWFRVFTTTNKTYYYISVRFFAMSRCFIGSCNRTHALEFKSRQLQTPLLKRLWSNRFWCMALRLAVCKCTNDATFNLQRANLSIKRKILSV